LKHLVALLVFFLAFYKISIFHPSLYGIFPFVLMFSFIFFFSSIRKEILININVNLAYWFLGFLFFCAINDTVGAGAKSFSTLLSVRLLSIIFLTLIPVIGLKYLLRSDYFLLKKVIFYAFILQTGFWVATFLSSDIKISLYSFMGHSNSVNLRSHNLMSRGFGFSTEINFTSPYVMVLVAFTLCYKALFRYGIFITQLFNSNNVLISFFTSLFFTADSNYRRLLYSFLVFFISVLFVYFSDVLGIIPRLSDELKAGGMRTLNILIQEHVHVLNANIFEHLFGTSLYIFDENSSVRSDIGWLIIYNHSGALGVLFALIIFIILCFRAFGMGSIFFLWFFSALWLNTKGLIISPNSFILMLLIFIFFNYRSANRK